MILERGEGREGEGRRGEKRRGKRLERKGRREEIMRQEGRGGAKEHNITQISSTPISNISVGHGTHKHTYTPTFPEWSWWDGVPFPLSSPSSHHKK